MTHLELSNSVFFELAEINSNMTDMDRLVNLYWSLTSVLRADVPGAIVELGCNVGLTSVLFSMVIEAEAPGRELHLFDSFQGLPAPSSHDAYLKEGDCPATAEQVRGLFRDRALPQPHVHEGWFEDTLPNSMPDQVAFAYLDGDFYESILTSLTYVWPRLAAGGSVVIDDYCDAELNPRAWAGLPGVRKACEEYFAPLGVTGRVLVGAGDLAFIEYRKS